MSTSPVVRSAPWPRAWRAPQTSTTGTSTFASDLQASVNRALEIASLPMQALQADQIHHQREDQRTQHAERPFWQLYKLRSKPFLREQAPMHCKRRRATSPWFPPALQATRCRVLTQSRYSMPVRVPAQLSNSATAVTDPTSQNISSSTSFTLTVGTSTYTITAVNLNALATAINSSGAPVQAVVINVGSPDSA